MDTMSDDSASDQNDVHQRITDLQTEINTLDNEIRRLRRLIRLLNSSLLQHAEQQTATRRSLRDFITAVREAANHYMAATDVP